jgi:NAD(P)-dependent dehydrogenase (short-subunit alcohol dehydrogenase family)
MAHPNRLKDAHVLVFGGTSGIGFGVASMALSNGARVTISGSTPSKVSSKVAELQSFYPDMPKEHVQGYACDLSDTANLEVNIKDVFEKATEGGQKMVDHVAFTAGARVKLPKLEEVSVDDVLSGFHMRLCSAVVIGKLLNTGRYMPSTQSSSFTITSGTNTLKPRPGWAVGASWGAASEGLSRGLAVDLKPIRVNCVAPGAIDTPLFEAFKANAGPEAVQKFKEGSLLGVWGTPEDEAEAYGWFMRDRFVTGEVARSDGGRMLVG